MSEDTQIVAEAREFLAKTMSQSDGTYDEAETLIAGLLAQIDRSNGIVSRPATLTVILASSSKGRHEIRQADWDRFIAAAAEKGITARLSTPTTLVCTLDTVNLLDADTTVMELLDQTSITDEAGDDYGSIRGLVHDLKAVFA